MGIRATIIGASPACKNLARGANSDLIILPKTLTRVLPGKSSFGSISNKEVWTAIAHTAQFPPQPREPVLQWTVGVPRCREPVLEVKLLSHKAITINVTSNFTEHQLLIKLVRMMPSIEISSFRWLRRGCLQLRGHGSFGLEFLRGNHGINEATTNMTMPRIIFGQSKFSVLGGAASFGKSSYRACAPGVPTEV